MDPFVFTFKLQNISKSHFGCSLYLKTKQMVFLYPQEYSNQEHMRWHVIDNSSPIPLQLKNFPFKCFQVAPTLHMLVINLMMQNDQIYWIQNSATGEGWFSIQKAQHIMCHAHQEFWNVYLNMSHTIEIYLRTKISMDWTEKISQNFGQIWISVK